MVTDTADFRFPHYHPPTDTSDRIDFDGLTGITLAVAGTLGWVAGVEGAAP